MRFRYTFAFVSRYSRIYRFAFIK